MRYRIDRAVVLNKFEVGYTGACTLTIAVEYMIQFYCTIIIERIIHFYRVIVGDHFMHHTYLCLKYYLKEFGRENSSETYQDGKFCGVQIIWRVKSD